MNILIIEDEDLAAEHLADLLHRTDESINILSVCDSVKSSIKWLKENDEPDLIFMDIQLGDGLSFDIFNKIDIQKPVIFTTAYEEYAIKAFKVNSVDYLLKPISPEDLAFALNKFRKTGSQNTNNQSIEASVLDKVREILNPKFKERFTLKVGEHIKSIPVNEINFFYSSEGSSYLCTNTGNNYIVDKSLEELEKVLDPQLFFRINRKYVVKLDAISDMLSFSSSRIKVKLSMCKDNDVIVSRDKVADFKNWLDR